LSFKKENPMTKKRTTHTIYGRVSSHGSGGRIDIEEGYPAITSSEFASPTLTTKLALNYPKGTGVVVRISLSGKRRIIKGVRIDRDVTGVDSFLRVYGAVLEREKRAYVVTHGKDFEGYEPKAPRATKAEKDMEWKEEPTKEEPTIAIDSSEWLEKIYIDSKDNELLNTIKKLSDRRHVAVMMIGPSGYGKTSIPQQKAKDWGMEFLRWDCATVRDPEEFFGFRGAIDGSTMTEDGETFFTPSEFTRVLEVGNCVIVLDELNRIDPYISNILFPLLDHAGKTNVANHEIVVGPNVIFVATVNLGFQFTGTFTLDTALNNRFTAKILVNALPRQVEEEILIARGGIDFGDAREIVSLMTGLRSLNAKDQLSVDCSTRVSIQIAELVGAGLSLRSALVYVVINGISDEEAKMVIDQFGVIG
jgi:MoxR-like ATPase